MSIYRKRYKIKDINKETFCAMVEDYDQGLTFDALRKKYRIHQTVIKRVFYEAEVISLPHEREIEKLIERGTPDKEILEKIPTTKENFQIIKRYAKVPDPRKITRADRNRQIKHLYEMGYNYTMIAGAFQNVISRQRVMQIVQEMNNNGEINP